MMHTLFRAALMLALWAGAAPAFATAYVFPGTLPAGCSGSGPSYTCGSLTLGNSDTIAIGAPRPATITVNGNLDVGRALINASGLASNLTVTVTGTLSVGNQGQINGSVSAASMTNPGGRANIGGSLTTSGSLSLGNSSTIAQCVRSSGAATITLGNGTTAGGVCCGALGSCTSSCVVNNTGAAMPALCASPPPSASTAGQFNAFDTATAAGSVTGVIHTKVAGAAFNLAVAAINTAGTGLATAFAGSVKVELLDSSNNSAALVSGTGCRSSWALAAGTASSTLTLAASDQGRKNIALTITNSWRDARVRVSYPATGTPTVVSCSTDNFAIRPASFASFSATDANYQTAGTTRTLANMALTGGNVHKAGQPFTVRATAVNGAGSPATTSNYTGTPTAFISACAGAACGGTLGTLTLSPAATAGVINTTASYTEAGAISLQLVDSSFANVDAADGSTTAEKNISSPALAIGRFVPDHFEMVVAGTGPTLRTFNSSTCSPRSFTYLGQPFGYATVPQATVYARNAAGNTTANYPDTRLNALVRNQAYALLPPGALITSATTLPVLVANGDGTATLTTQATDRLTITRPTTTPLAPFNADISLTWSVSDNSATGTGNGPITMTAPLSMPSIPFDMGNEFRFGVLKMGSGYGSELISLGVPVELQYWNGNAFITNANDQCTTLATSALALGNFRSNLAACETAPGAATVTFTAGRGLLRMLAPGSGNAGSVDGTINLAAVAAGNQCSAVGAPATPATTVNMPWLQGRLGAAGTYNVNPSARFSFGQYRSPLIHLREVY